ncbi:MAG: hypothetical protein RIS92_113 [Verrucomicrobiota bacterium]
MCCVADEQVGGGDGDAFVSEAFDFSGDRDGVEDDAVADDAHFIGAKDSGRDEVQDVFGSSDDDRVTGVIAALGANDDVGVFGEEIDDFAFAFITPLGADENGVCHRENGNWE